MPRPYGTVHRILNTHRISLLSPLELLGVLSIIKMVFSLKHGCIRTCDSRLALRITKQALSHRLKKKKGSWRKLRLC
jgi:hypothetical protein